MTITNRLVFSAQVKTLDLERRYIKQRRAASAALYRLAYHPHCYTQGMSSLVRKAHREEIPKLIELGKKLYLVEKQFEPELTFSAEEAIALYQKQFQNPQALFLVIEDQSQIVGYLYAHCDAVEYLATAQPECEIEVIYLEPTYRGHHLSEKLIQNCLTWAKTQNVFRVKAGIFAQNKASQKAFAKQGFQPQHVTYTFEL